MEPAANDISSKWTNYLQQTANLSDSEFKKQIVDVLQHMKSKVQSVTRCVKFYPADTSNYKTIIERASKLDDKTVQLRLAELFVETNPVVPVQTTGKPALNLVQIFQKLESDNFGEDASEVYKSILFYLSFNPSPIELPRVLKLINKHFEKGMRDLEQLIPATAAFLNQLCIRPEVSDKVLENCSQELLAKILIEGKQHGSYKLWKRLNSFSPSSRFLYINAMIRNISEIDYLIKNDSEFSRILKNFIESTYTDLMQTKRKDDRSLLTVFCRFCKKVDRFHPNFLPQEIKSLITDKFRLDTQSEQIEITKVQFAILLFDCEEFKRLQIEKKQYYTHLPIKGDTLKKLLFFYAPHSNEVWRFTSNELIDIIALAALLKNVHVIKLALHFLEPFMKRSTGILYSLEGYQILERLYKLENKTEFLREEIERLISLQAAVLELPLRDNMPYYVQILTHISISRLREVCQKGCLAIWEKTKRTYNAVFVDYEENLRLLQFMENHSFTNNKERVQAVISSIFMVKDSSKKMEFLNKLISTMSMYTEKTVAKAQMQFDGFEVVESNSPYELSLDFTHEKTELDYDALKMLSKFSISQATFAKRSKETMLLEKKLIFGGAKIVYADDRAYDPSIFDNAWMLAKSI